LQSLNVHPFSEAYLHKALLSNKLCTENPQLLQSLSAKEGSDDEVTKNLVGRLNSTTVVKTALTASLGAIHRAAGMEVPYERAPSTPKQRKSSKKIDPLQIEMTPVSTSTSRQPTHSPGFIRSDAPVPESDSDKEDFELELSTIKSRSESPEPPRRSTFLPALSTGYIPASDSSDPDEEYNSFAPLKKERKNRRGQRERQAIWLKKYGSNARHLHPELKKRKVSNTKTLRENKSEDQGVQKAVEVPVDTEVVKKVNDPHPSWVAKQKQREQQKAIMTSIKPKKIVFD
jgi:hypothetical protein